MGWRGGGVRIIETSRCESYRSLLGNILLVSNLTTYLALEVWKKVSEYRVT